MKIHKVDKDKMKIPPKWLIREYLALDPPRKFRSDELRKDFKDNNTKNQFLNKAADFNLVVRLKRGLYFAPEPEIAIKTWSMDDYHSRLILLNSTFEGLDVDHTFYCLSAHHHTDYSPGKVIPVLKKDHDDIDQRHIDHFVYDFSKGEELRLEVFDSAFTIPVLTKKDTAILLLSTYMQREVDAGKKLLEEIELDHDIRAVLSGLGYDRYGEGEFKEVKIKRPLFIQDWIKEIGFENIKEKAGR